MKELKDHTAEDVNEEVQTALYIMSKLDGKPIVKTSGDENHTMNIQSVGVKIGMNNSGDELSFTITTADRHHPHLVYDTIREELAKLPELKDHNLKALDAEKDYNKETGEMTVRYDIAGGVADDIIHALSKAQQAKMPMPAEIKAAPEQCVAQNDPQYDQNWVNRTTIDRTVAFFTGRA